MDQLQGIALALIPSVGIGFLFYKVIRLILEGDRKERLAHSRWEARHGGHPGTDGRSGEVGSESPRQTPVQSGSPAEPV